MYGNFGFDLEKGNSQLYFVFNGEATNLATHAQCKKNQLPLLVLIYKKVKKEIKIRKESGEL